MKVQKNAVTAAAWVGAALWYSLIWWFSAQTAAVSGSASDRLLYRLLRAVSSAFAASGETVRVDAVELLSFFVRKGAHMFLYFVLALLLLAALRAVRRRAVCTLALCALASSVDEYHQTLVAGRSGEVRDVCIDLCGALIAVALIAFLCRARGARRGMAGESHTAFFVCAAALLLFAAAPTVLSPQSLLPLAERFLPDFAARAPAAREHSLTALFPVVSDALRIVLCALSAVYLAARSLWRRKG